MPDTRKCPECGQSLSRMTHGANIVNRCKKCGYQVNVNIGKVIHGHNAKVGQRQYLNCPGCSARLSAPKNLGVLELDCPFCLHSWSFDSGTPLDAPQWNTGCPKCGKRVLINKNEGPRKVTCPHCQQIFRFQSDTGEQLPDATVSGDSVVVTCPECGTKNRVPAGRGNLRITCGHCAHQFYLAGDPALAPKPSGEKRTREQPKAHERPEPRQATPPPKDTGAKPDPEREEWEYVRNSTLSVAIATFWCNVFRKIADVLEQGDYAEISVGKQDVSFTLYFKDGDVMLSESRTFSEFYAEAKRAGMKDYDHLPYSSIQYRSSRMLLEKTIKQLAAKQNASWLELRSDGKLYVK